MTWYFSYRVITTISLLLCRFALLVFSQHRCWVHIAPFRSTAGFSAKMHWYSWSLLFKLNLFFYKVRRGKKKNTGLPWASGISDLGYCWKISHSSTAKFCFPRNFSGCPIFHHQAPNALPSRQHNLFMGYKHHCRQRKIFLSKATPCPRHSCAPGNATARFCQQICE